MTSPPTTLARLTRPIRARLARMTAELVDQHVEFNYRSIADHVAPDARVLDVGAWDGRLGGLLHQRRGCDVVNVDVVNHNATSLPFVLYDGRTLPMADGSFDVVLLMYVLHHSRDEQRLLAEAARVCRPGGLLLIAEDRVDGLWRRCVTLLFHVWLLVTTRLTFHRFRTIQAWTGFFGESGLALERTLPLGPHMGRRFWPENVVFVLRRP